MVVIERLLKDPLHHHHHHRRRHHYHQQHLIMVPTTTQRCCQSHQGGPKLGTSQVQPPYTYLSWATTTANNTNTTEITAHATIVEITGSIEPPRCASWNNAYKMTLFKLFSKHKQDKLERDQLVTLPLFLRKSKKRFVVEYCDWSHFKDNSLVDVVLEFHWSREIIS